MMMPPYFEGQDDFYKEILKNKWYWIVGAVLLAAMFALIVIMAFTSHSMRTINLDVFEEKIKQTEIENPTIKIPIEVIYPENANGLTEIRFLTNKEERFSVILPPRDLDRLIPILIEKDLWGTAGFRRAGSDSFGWWILMIVAPMLILPFLIQYFFTRKSAKGPSADQPPEHQDFTKSGARRIINTGVTFPDVAGQDEAKEDLEEVVEFLKHPERFQALGAKMPRGVLLVGPPGTGKTLLGKAVAGEAGVVFFSISGSGFVEMFVGVGASRVRNLFSDAKKEVPCIIFIDELDAIGRQRGAGVGGGHDEMGQTLNQILVEMDGFDTNSNVIVMAATNRPDILDPALLRPGRFDRQVVLDLPDRNSRKAILAVHARGKPLNSKVDLDHWARQTPGLSGAHLANLINEAAIYAAKAGKREIGNEDFKEALERVTFGKAKKDAVISEKERKITAVHEGGHAIVAYFLPKAPDVQKVSIISHGRIGGYTQYLPTEEDKRFYQKSELIEMIAAALGGLVAEEIVFGEHSTGPQNDLARVRDIASNMVTIWGMDENLPLQALGARQEMVFLGKQISEQRDYSEETSKKIDEAKAKIIKEAEETAQRIIGENRDTLDRLVEALLAKETLEDDELKALLEGRVEKLEPDRAEAAEKPGGNIVSAMVDVAKLGVDVVTFVPKKVAEGVAGVVNKVLGENNHGSEEDSANGTTNTDDQKQDEGVNN